MERTQYLAFSDSCEDYRTTIVKMFLLVFKDETQINITRRMPVMMLKHIVLFLVLFIYLFKE